MASERKTRCRNHCRRCGRHFTSTRGFDWHLAGPISDRRCIDPAEDEKGRFTAHDGECAILIPEGRTPEPGTVWSVR